MTTTSFNFIDYLAAKKSVDDRALNQHVRQSLVQHLPPANPQAPLRVLEIAAGIGTMLERLVDWHILGSAVYTAIDLNPAYMAEAQRRLPLWAENRGFQVRQEAVNILVFERAQQKLKVVLEISDVFDFVAREQNSHRWDLLIAHAFLDLVDLPALLPPLFSLLSPNGLIYFTINFDGETILLPEIDPQLDGEIITLYHRAMDEQRVNGQPVGGSRAGRQLFKYLPAAGAQIIDAGSSDWLVFANDGGYPYQEAFFLHCIINTIRDTLHNQTSFEINPWLEQRHQQIDRGELVYVAHQLDFLGKLKP